MKCSHSDLDRQDLPDNKLKLWDSRQTQEVITVGELQQLKFQFASICNARYEKFIPVSFKDTGEHPWCPSF